ncbi:hypothetical protein ELG97_37135 [Rhizobium leguminosarum]|uniref:hypothetical protein n=1 Tax=Rhizobium leguminosarum TaxID=384 RepID=UPI00102F9E5F|nr:hypothetical protein [Rhizobium leguminosarum]TBE73856.1 hypothetical protein ELG97_37135 [Rhizobium leguminosarum]
MNMSVGAIASDIELILPHELPARLPKEEAAHVLREQLIAFRDQFLEWVRGGKEGPRPQLCIKGEQSLGKTALTIEMVEEIFGALLDEFPELKIVMLVPFLHLGAEVEKKALKRMDNVHFVRGRSQPQPGYEGIENPPLMCAKADIAEQLAAMSIPVSTTLCRKKLENGEIQECPFAATCAYLAQQEKAKHGGLIIASHQYLGLHFEILKDADLLIVDESFHQVLTSSRDVDLMRFLTLRGPGEGHKQRKGEGFMSYEQRRDEDDFDLKDHIHRFRKIVFNAEIEKRQPLVGEFREAGFTAEACRYLAGLEYSRIVDPDINPAMAVEVQRDRLKRAEIQEAFAFARIWNLLAKELSEGLDEYAPVSFQITYSALGNKIACDWSRDPIISEAATLILDGSADRAITSRFFPEIGFERINAEWNNFELVQARNKGGSANSMQGRKRRDEVYNAALDMIDRLADRIEKVTYDHEGLLISKEQKRPLIIGNKNLADELRADPYLSAHAAIDHLGNIRGVDLYKHCVGAIFVGRLEPNVEAAERIARGIFGPSKEPYNFIKPGPDGQKAFPRRKQWLTAKNGDRVIVDVSYHPDWRVDAVLRQIREEELMQAIARVRPVHRPADNPVQIIVLTNIPLPIQPTRIFNWSQIVPDRIDLERLGGWQPESAYSRVDSYPEYWSSRTAVWSMVSRREERAFPAFEGRAATLQNPLYNQMEVARRWVRVSYDRPGNMEEEAGSGWMRVREGDTAETIAQRVKHFIKDADNIDVAMLETPAAANDNRTPAALHPSIPGARTITRAALALAQSVSPETKWWYYLPRYKNNFEAHRERLAA